jgi:hypothetical protein
LSDEPTFRGTNPFPELLLVVLTLSNLVPLAQAGMMALVVLAGVIGWSGLSFESISMALLVVAAPVFHVVGPLLTWLNRRWRYDLRLILVTAPLLYLALLYGTSR